MSADRVQAAEQAFHRGDLDRASQICAEILRTNPKSAPANLLLGLIAAQKNHLPQAIQNLQAALQLSPNDYVALTWLQVVLRKAACFEEAIQTGLQARKLWPQDLQILTNLSHAYLGAGNIEAGAECLSKSVSLKPNDPALHRRLGIAYELLGRDEDAATEFKTAISLSPTTEVAYVRLVTLLLGHGNFPEAIELCEQGLQKLPNSAQLHLALAQALRGARHHELAQSHLQQAIALDTHIVISAAMWLSEEGKFDEAADLYRQSIRLKPNQGVAYFGLLKGKKATDTDREFLATMQGLLDNQTLPPKEQAALHYGLGNAQNDLGEYESAMHHFDAGNALNYQIYLAGQQSNAESLNANRQKIEAMFTPEFMAARKSFGDQTVVPIFVIGMIRSGTTLVDQILASHHDVASAGEQRFWVNELPNVVDLESQTLNEEKFEEIRDRYLRVLRSLQPDSKRVTDKMPLNYYCAGAIHLAYPNARIVHIRRHPVDTALSIYMTDLAKPPVFAHCKSRIVSEYRNYQALMAHWRTVIPKDRLFEVQYEDLVADQEHWTRQILEFCALDWDPACLNFHTNDRQVNTPSMWQVRQPIYKTSVDKWKRYEPWLGAFADLLDQEPPCPTPVG